MEVVLSESREDTSDVAAVFLDRIRKDQNVVQVDDDKKVGHILKDVIHKVPESGRCICESHGHYDKLERAIAGTKGGLPFMVGCYADVIISHTQVEFGINLGGAQLVNQIGDQRNRVVVVSGNTIEIAKIHTKSECTVLLLCKENWGPSRRVGCPDEALSKHII